MAKEFKLTKKDRKPNDIVRLICVNNNGLYPKLGLKFRGGFAQMSWGEIEAMYQDPTKVVQFREHWMRSFGPVDEFKGQPARQTVIVVHRLGSTSEQLAAELRRIASKENPTEEELLGAESALLQATETENEEGRAE